MEILAKPVVPNQNGPWKIGPTLPPKGRRISGSSSNQPEWPFSGIKFWCLFQGGYCLIFQKLHLSKHIVFSGPRASQLLDANLKFSPHPGFSVVETSLERKPSKRLPKLPVRNPKQNMASRSDMTQTNLGLRPTQCPQTVEKMCTERCKCSTWTFQFV